jgi:hypothetical protein
MVRSRRCGTPLPVAILRYNQNCWAFPFCFITLFQLNLMLLNKEAPISEEFNVGIEVVFRKENATLNCWMLIQEQMVLEGNLII